MNAAEIAKALGGRRSGNGFIGRCPTHADRSPSLSIRNGDDGRILVHCFAGCDPRDVIAELSRMDLWPGGDAPPPTAAEIERRRRQEADREREAQRREAFVGGVWRKTWAEAQPAPGSPIETWLRARGIDPGALDLDDLPLRWSPSCPLEKTTAPAMVALMTDPITAEPCGLHRTFLSSDGSAKAFGKDSRKMLGKAGIIRLSRDEDVELGLGIAEGVETALAIMAFGWRPIWAGGSLGGLQKFPVLGGIERLRIFADPKPHEIAGARECARRWAAAGREAAVHIPNALGDFNDLLGSAA